MRQASVAYPARSVASNGRESNAPSGPRRSLSATSRRRHGGLVTAAGRQGTAEVPTVSSAAAGWAPPSLCACRGPARTKRDSWSTQAWFPASAISKVGGSRARPGRTPRSPVVGCHTAGNQRGSCHQGTRWRVDGRRQTSTATAAKGGVRSQPRWAGAADCHGDDRWVGQVGGAQANIGPCCLLGAGNPCWKREVGGRPGHRTSHGHGRWQSGDHEAVIRRHR
jgi:hypothetical protein